MKQGLKYYNALKSILDQQQVTDPNIEVIFVLGHKPGARGAGAIPEDVYIEQQFGTCRGRYVLYDRLIEGAQSQYDEYLQASDKAKDSTRRWIPKSSSNSSSSKAAWSGPAMQSTEDVLQGRPQEGERPRFEDFPVAEA